MPYAKAIEKIKVTYLKQNAVWSTPPLLTARLVPVSVTVKVAH
jgi:hypothetical protein